MSHFHSIKELLNILSRSQALLAEMFEKRKTFPYKYEQAALLMDEEQLEVLKHRGILRQNGPYLEIDEQFLQFFEQVLAV